MMNEKYVNALAVDRKNPRPLKSPLGNKMSKEDKL
jgi:hypothetical protein